MRIEQKFFFLKKSKHLKILDLGGTINYWEDIGFLHNDNGLNFEITLLNLDKVNVKHQNFKSIKGDATNLSNFKDNQFDFVIASHVIEHVKDVNTFIKELSRVSSKGYIELPTILEDNLVFENKNDHIWHTEFDDIGNKINISKKIQYLEPILTVSSSKKFAKIFRQSLVLELYCHQYFLNPQLYMPTFLAYLHCILSLLFP